MTLGPGFCLLAGLLLGVLIGHSLRVAFGRTIAGRRRTKWRKSRGKWSVNGRF